MRPFEIGCLHGYELNISPLANLKPKNDAAVYGILAQLTHSELDRLYQDHAREKLGGNYMPEAVTAYLLIGIHTPALCYISHDMAPGKADPSYVERILKPAADYGFPRWYLNHIQSFK